MLVPKVHKDPLLKDKLKVYNKDFLIYFSKKSKDKENIKAKI